MTKGGRGNFADKLKENCEANPRLVTYLNRVIDEVVVFLNPDTPATIFSVCFL